MKILSAIFALMSFSLHALHSEEGFRTVFSVPPYQAEETVAGIEGWKMISSGKSEKATVHPMPNDTSKTGLLLRTHGIQRDLEEPLHDVVNVTAILEVASPLSGGGWSLVFMPAVGVGVGAAPFGFEAMRSRDEEDGGFFYTEKTVDESNDRIILNRKYLLPQSEVSQGAKYTLSATLDLSSRTYTLSITGEDGEGQPVKVESEKISMEAPGKSMTGNPRFTGLRIASNMPDRMEIYIESISMTPSSH